MIVAPYGVTGAIGVTTGQSPEHIARTRTTRKVVPVSLRSKVMAGMSRDLLVFATALLGSAGCDPSAWSQAQAPDPLQAQAHAEIDRIGQEARAALDRVDDEQNALLITPICDPLKFPKIVQCGLISDEILAPAFIDEFVRDVCHESAPVSAGCASQFGELASARFKERYTRADVEAIQLSCTTYPKDCATLQLIEFKWLKSHDERVNAFAMERRDVILAAQKTRGDAVVERYRMAASERRRAELVEAQGRRERAAAALGAIGAGLQAYGSALQRQPQPVNCSSQTIGVTTFTNCR
jgi:hypothetical protein